LLILQKTKFDLIKIHVFVDFSRYAVVVYIVEVFFVVMFWFLQQESEPKFVANFVLKLVARGMPEQVGLQPLLVARVPVLIAIRFIENNNCALILVKDVKVHFVRLSKKVREVYHQSLGSTHGLFQQILAHV